MVNANGNVTKDYDYDAFGVEVEIDPNDRNVFRYSGEYWDKETGTYYLRNRMYNPKTGRFTQPDTHWNPGNMIYEDNPKDPSGLNIYTPDISAIRQSGNLYAYGLNNPVMYVDYNGNFAMPIPFLLPPIVPPTNGASKSSSDIVPFPGSDIMSSGILNGYGG